MHQPNNVFEIEAVPEGSMEPNLLVIEDNHHQWERMLSDKPSIRYTITSMEIADDFILHTSRNGPNMTEQAHPPVWICRDADGKPAQYPSENEIIENIAAFHLYCQAEVNDADELHARREAGETKVPRNTPRQKACARYMNYEREWLTVKDPNAQVRCPFCTTSIASFAIKCPKCAEIINPQKYAERMRERNKVNIAAIGKTGKEAPEATV